MIFINIMTNFLDLLLAKRDISNYLIEQKEIEEEYTVEEFIKYLNFGSQIYCHSMYEVYPFSLLSIGGKDYLFYVTDEKQDNKEPKLLFDKLQELKYDFSNLIKKDKFEIAQEEIQDSPHFILNGELFYEEQK